MARVSDYWPIHQPCLDQPAIPPNWHFSFSILAWYLRALFRCRRHLHHSTIPLCPSSTWAGCAGVAGWVVISSRNPWPSNPPWRSCWSHSDFLWGLHPTRSQNSTPSYFLRPSAPAWQWRVVHGRSGLTAWFSRWWILWTATPQSISSAQTYSGASFAQISHSSAYSSTQSYSLSFFSQFHFETSA